MYSSKEVRKHLADGKLDKAAAMLLQLTQNTELQEHSSKLREDLQALEDQNSANTYSNEEHSDQYNHLKRAMLDLTEAYDVLQLKNMYGHFNQIRQILVRDEYFSDTVSEKADELYWLADFIPSVEQREDVETEIIARLGAFLNQIHTIDSKVYRHLIKSENQPEILRKIAYEYNAVADWLALPQIPTSILRRTG